MILASNTARPPGATKEESAALKTRLSIMIVMALAAIPASAVGQDAAAAPQQPAAATPAAPPARGARPPAPTRDPQTPGYVAATMLPDGAVPPADAIGNFVIGPTHPPAPEMTAKDRRSAGHGSHLHDGIDGQQDLSGHRARARQPRDGRSERSGKTHRQQRTGALHAACRGVRAAAICARHDCAAASSAQTGRIRCCSPRSTT